MSDRRQGVRLVLADDIGRGAMHGLIEAPPSAAQAGARQHAQTARQQSERLSSERMSPNMFSVTSTSKRRRLVDQVHGAGIHQEIARAVTSGYSSATCKAISRHNPLLASTFALSTEDELLPPLPGEIKAQADECAAYLAARVGKRVFDSNALLVGQVRPRGRLEIVARR